MRCEAGPRKPWEQVRFHLSSVESIAELRDVTREVLALDSVVGAEQESLQVRQRDMHPWEELVRWFLLAGNRGGGMDKAFAVELPIAAPSVGKNVASGPDFGSQKAVQALGGGVGQHAQRGKARHGRASRLPLGTVFDGDGNHGLVLAAASAAPRTAIPRQTTCETAAPSTSRSSL